MDVTSSSRTDKTYMVSVDDRMVHFGAMGYDDFTVHNDERRKANYLARHTHENWSDKSTAGFGARWLLWNKPTLAESIRDVNNRFGLKVRLYSRRDDVPRQINGTRRYVYSGKW